jgi:NitT/TauT family transport system ATP-binding protein
MAERETVIRIRGLDKVFVTEDRERVPVFTGLNLDIARGEFVSLLGPTGCGKTTLLRILLGLEPPTRGRVEGGETNGRPAGRIAAGVVFQQNALFPWRRAIDNVAFPLRMKGWRRRDARREAARWLERVHLDPAGRAYPYEMSGGMQQRASIARALALGAEVLLLDEPFGALDVRTRRALQEMLLELWGERRLTVVFVTHHIEEALVLGSRLVVLGRGGVLEDRPVDLPRPRDGLSEAFGRELLDVRRILVRAFEGPADAPA